MNYLPNTYTMLTASCSNSEMLASPYCLFNIEPLSINNSPIYAFLAKMFTPLPIEPPPLFINPLLFGARE